MSLNIVTEGSTASPAAHTDDENTVYLRSREPAMSGGDSQTVDVWNGSTAAIRELYRMYRPNPLIASMGITQNGEKSDLRITWGVDFTDGEEPQDDPDVEPVDEIAEWSWNFIEVPTPLAAHPYFQTAYVTEAAEELEDAIARCDAAIKRGRKFTASGDYAQWVSRYYALRMAGVEEWIQYGVELVRTHTVDNVIDAQKTHIGVGMAFDIAGTNAPQDVVDAINAIDRIEEFKSAHPSDFKMERASFEFVKRAPNCAYSTIQGNPRFDITETWVGLAQWSAVLYPNGSWDPTGDVE